MSVLLTSLRWHTGWAWSVYRFGSGLLLRVRGVLRTKDTFPEALLGLLCGAAHRDGSCAEATVVMRVRGVIGRNVRWVT